MIVTKNKATGVAVSLHHATTEFSSVEACLELVKGCAPCMDIKLVSLLQCRLIP